MRTESAPLIRVDAPRFRYRPALDGMRGVGVLIVMFYHYGGDMWLEGGPILIDLFFVLSAFLITNLLLDEMNRDGSINLRGFYHRRILRLFPAMYTLLGVVAVIAVIGTILGVEELRWVWAEIAAVALYVYNLFLAFFGLPSPGTPRVLVHLWTLSMEEWFYFIWPFALIWGLRRAKNQRPLLLGAVLFIAFWMGTRIIAGLTGHAMREESEILNLAYPLKVVLRFSIMRPDSLVVGCLAAIASRSVHTLSDNKRRLLNIAGMAGGLWILAVVFLGGHYSFFLPFAGIGYNLGILGQLPFIIWMYGTPDGRTSKFFRPAIWVWLGARSYGIYIWHMIPAMLFPKLGYGLAALFLRMAVLMGISIGIAELSWRFIETPFLRRKQKSYTSISGR